MSAGFLAGWWERREIFFLIKREDWWYEWLVGIT